MARGKSPSQLRESLRDWGKHLGSEYGAKGAETTNAKLTTAQRKSAGKKAAEALTPEQRKERAKTAAAARWKKNKSAKKMGKKAD